MANITSLQRPMPPTDLVAMEGLVAPDRFLAAFDVVDWIRTAYLDEHGPLHNPDHAHLDHAHIGVLWTNAANTRNMRRIVGQAEMPARSGGTSGKWQKARAEQQLREWFGGLPDFLITLDALHASQADDLSFAALLDHELYHCAQAEDEFGMLKFSRETGEPLWTIRGHDVEEFVGVVRRFGVEAAGEKAADLVAAASRTPAIAPARLAQACGTCVRRAA